MLLSVAEAEAEGGRYNATIASITNGAQNLGIAEISTAFGHPFIGLQCFSFMASDCRWINGIEYGYMNWATGSFTAPPRTI